MIICRCEQVTDEQLKSAILEDGCQTINEVKKLTRAGMGVCQGRICHRLVGLAVAELTGNASAPHQVRPPVRPVPMARLAAMQQAEGRAAQARIAQAWAAQAGAIPTGAGSGEGQKE